MIGRSNVLGDGWTTNENKVDQKQKFKGLKMYIRSYEEVP